MRVRYLRPKQENMSADTQKLKALQMTLDRMDKTFGKGAVMKLGDEAVEAIESIPSDH